MKIPKIIKIRKFIIVALIVVLVLAGLEFILLNPKSVSTSASAVSGPLEVDPTNRHYLTDGTKNVFLAGTSSYKASNFSISSAEIHADVDSYLNSSSALDDLNYTRFWPLRPWDWADSDPNTKARFPWKEQTDYASSYKFNLNADPNKPEEWDQAYWANIKDFIGYAQTKGLYVNMMIFDECGLEGSEEDNNAGKIAMWKKHPFYYTNNSNNTGLSENTGIPSSGQSFYSEWNNSSYGVELYQQKYITKLIKELAPYKNVSYEIVNEYARGTVGYETQVAEFVKSEMDRLSSQSKYITMNHIGSLTPPWGAANMNGYNFHESVPTVAPYAQLMSGFYSKNIPIQCNECSADMTIDNMRKVAFGMLTTGGTFAFDDSGNPVAEKQVAGRFLKFLRGATVSGDTRQGVNYREMTPNNTYYKGTDGVTYVKTTPGSSTAYTLAKKGSEYVVFLDGNSSSTGSMTIDLPDPGTGKEYRAVAFDSDPSKTTEYYNLSVPARGGSSSSVGNIPSFGSSQVVYIRAITTLPPPPPSGNDLLTNVNVSGSTLTYKLVPSLAAGGKFYTDRSYTISSLPAELQGTDIEWLTTPNMDKKNANLSLKLTLASGADVYIAFDTRNPIPSWMTSGGWTNTGSKIVTTTGTKDFPLFKKTLPSGDFILGFNNNTNLDNSMYFVAAKPNGTTPPPPPVTTCQASGSSISLCGNNIATAEADNGVIAVPMAKLPSGAPTYVATPSGTGWGLGNSAFTVDPNTNTGSYTMWAYVYWPKESQNSFYVKADNGSNVTLTDNTLGSWHWVKLGSTLNFTTSGNHTLKIIGREGGSQMDKFILTKDTAYRP